MPPASATDYASTAMLLSNTQDATGKSLETCDAMLRVSVHALGALDGMVMGWQLRSLYHSLQTMLDQLNPLLALYQVEELRFEITVDDLHRQQSVADSVSLYRSQVEDLRAQIQDRYERLRARALDSELGDGSVFSDKALQDFAAPDTPQR